MFFSQPLRYLFQVWVSHCLSCCLIICLFPSTDLWVNAQLHSVFLFCSIIITQLLWISSKSELQVTCFILTLALNFKDWTFGVIVTRHFRPKSGLLNERVHCEPIDRTLKMIYIRWGVGQLSKINYFWVMEVTGFWIKKRHKYNKTLKIFPSKNKSFHNLQKVSKSAVLNTMAVYLW